MRPRFSPSCDRSCVKMANRFASRRYSLKNKLGDRMIKQLLNSVIAKYRDLSVSRRSIICFSLRLRQIIDLRDIDKSWYFAITEFNNCFIIRSPSLCFRNIFGKRSDLPFSHKSNRKKEKSMVSFTHEQNSLCSQKQLNDIAALSQIQHSNWLTYSLAIAFQWVS